MKPLQRGPLGQVVVAVITLVVLLIPDASYSQSPVAPQDTVRAGRFDSGRMWTFDFPPTEYFQEEYGIQADDAWFDRARLSALRIPGCSASFVSSSGLVMTNHHCARTHVSAVTREGENLLDEGFYAQTLADERQAPTMYADQLVAIEDVTEEIYAAMTDAQTDAERAAAREDAISAAHARVLAGTPEGHIVQIISLYNGARYSAYTFRRYTDVRLVLTPELQIGYFGGDTDNFSYPRYALDMTFFRVYENDRPLETANYFAWSPNGAAEDEAVFVVGNPGSTNRLETVSQLEYRRDVAERYMLEWVNRRVASLEAYLDEVDASDAIRNQLFSMLNVQKLYTGRVGGLENEILMARRRDTERQFREAIESDPDLRETYGGLLDEMADLQAQRIAMLDEYAAFSGLAPNSSLGSSVMRRAMLAASLLEQQEQGAETESLAQLRDQISRIQDQPEPLQEMYLADRVEMFNLHLAERSDQLAELIAGRSAAEVAGAIIEESALTNAAATAAVLEAGTLAEDPAVQLARSVYPIYANYQSAIAGISAQEQDIGSRLGRARFDIYGTDIPPDATFSLRIADGIVKGYPYNGTIAPIHTTFYGMYDRYYSFGPGTEWDLPDNWVSIPQDLELSTPINFVSTNDIIGGNSGSAVLNQNLEVVGLAFDGNLEFLPSSFIYVTETGRTISVDSRGMIEALDAVYDADRIVQELRTGSMVMR